MEQQNKKGMTLGSLFDGSGGFPLGGVLSGITPVWASEIEPFPVRVTTARFPNMKHLGDITKIKGSEIGPVDIITFGSPCQDMSVAGKREGLDGNRSSLFYEAIRIIKEMREDTNGKYPRYIVWENVPGAFSSNKGEDFKAVLTEICKVKDSEVFISKPRKWEKAGRIMGDSYSIAWRVFDAQFWGVPQRRQRIYLVADFDGGSAGEILFESEGLSGYSAEGFKSWQSSAGGSTESIGENGCGLMFENHSQDTRFEGPLEVAQTVSATFGTGGNNQPFVVEKPHTYDVRLTSEGTRNGRHNIYETVTSRTVDIGGNIPDSNQGGIAIVEQRTFGICAKNSNSMKSNNPNSGFYEAETSRCLATLSANEGGKGSSGQMMKNPEETFVGEVSYGIGRPAMNQGYNAKFSFQIEEEVEPTLVASGASGVAHPRFSSSKASFFTETSEEFANTLVATDYKDPPIVNDGGGADYIVRRLTPTECARLQGFPDWWCDGLGIPAPSDSDISKWREIFNANAKVMGKSGKPKTDNQIRKWLQNPRTDSAEYKMWGNGVALPIVYFVLSGIMYYAQKSAK